MHPFACARPPLAYARQRALAHISCYAFALRGARACRPPPRASALFPAFRAMRRTRAPVHGAIAPPCPAPARARFLPAPRASAPLPTFRATRHARALTACHRASVRLIARMSCYSTRRACAYTVYPTRQRAPLHRSSAARHTCVACKARQHAVAHIPPWA